MCNVNLLWNMRRFHFLIELLLPDFIVLPNTENPTYLKHSFNISNTTIHISHLYYYYTELIPNSICTLHSNKSQHSKNMALLFKEKNVCPSLYCWVCI